MDSIYQCDINDIEKEINILKEKLIFTKNPVDYELCFTNLGLLDELYKCITNKSCFDYKISKNYVHKYINACKFNLKNNNKFMKCFIENKNYLNLITEKVVDILDENIEYGNLYNDQEIKEEEALEIIYEYLNKFHSDEIVYFDKLRKNKRIFNACSFYEEEGEEILGECYLSYNEAPLIAVKNDKYSIKTIRALIHEFGHAVEMRKMLENYSNNQTLKYFYSSFYTEVNSMKYEKQFLDFCFQNNIYVNQIKKNLENFYVFVLMSTEDTYEFTNIQDFLLENYKYLLCDDEFINKNLIVPYEENDEIIYFSNIDLSDSIRYFIGGIFSIYYSNLYYDDKDEAKRLYKLFNSVKLDNFNSGVLELLNIDQNNLTQYIKNDAEKIKVK